MLVKLHQSLVKFPSEPLSALLSSWYCLGLSGSVSLQAKVIQKPHILSTFVKELGRFKTLIKYQRLVLAFLGALARHLVAVSTGVSVAVLTVRPRSWSQCVNASKGISEAPHSKHSRRGAWMPRDADRVEHQTLSGCTSGCTCHTPSSSLSYLCTGTVWIWITGCPCKQREFRSPAF